MYLPLSGKKDLLEELYNLDYEEKVDEKIYADNTDRFCHYFYIF